MFNLGDLPPIPPVYVPPSTDFLQLYPAICLAGCKSPVNDFVAQIEVDRENGRRFLLVRHQSRHKFIMIAPQSRVEEFLWLPTGYEIIYTATGDNQYRDGVFLWNLLTDETRNLLDDVDLGLLNSSSQSEEPKYFLSLAALSSVGRKAYIYIAPRLASELDPGQFFSAASLYAIQLSDKEHPKAIFSHPHPAGPNLFAMQNSLTRDINRGMQGSPLQMRWASLPLDGKMGGLLEAWQDFSMACAESPIFPYSLWWLGFIYSDAYRATFPISQKHALTLKAFGTEIAGALVALNQAPSHLRAMGVYMGNHLRGPSALTYSLVSIAPPTKADLKK